uniref:uncharacterized protein LOC100185953 n=1 Tax=Ciona intestinalis TaxID=7719 RepID=UPI00005210C2|nr:uncharacterized protein LOC100185953 [Ciona intestinalis]|eukprot:XP_002129988.1 uncharacterized protein LOC100185953 [Ciona intestinalis]
MQIKIFWVSLFVVLVSCFHNVCGQSGEGLPFEHGERYEVGFAVCNSHAADGSISSSVMYDECNSFCCGGQVILNSTHLDCCGSRDFGSPYSKRYERCCEWWTGHGRAHSKRSFNYGSVGCCGASVIDWGRDRCCYGDSRIVPSVFYYRRQKCCGGRVIPISRTLANHWDAGCCGTTSTYDKRRQSCPCDDGQVVDAPSSRTGCCRSPYGGTAPYIPDTQICCNGVVGNKTNNFCCDNLSAVGVVGESVCCGGNLVTISPPNANLTECCNGSPYDPRFNVCCNSRLMGVVEGANQCCGAVPYSETKSICCDLSLWSRETEGTECCGRSAYFPDQGLACCQGRVFLVDAFGGDTCCGLQVDSMQYYYRDSNEFVCCNDVLNDSPSSTSSSCCGTRAYDTSTSICCDGQIFDKALGSSCCNGSPYFPSSRHICCGNGPFGPFATPRCCGGEGFDIQGGTVCCGGRVYGKYRSPSCCVDVGYDVTKHTCCGSSILPNPHGTTEASCCGSYPYDRKTELCCQGTNVTIPASIPKYKAQCCESNGVYNPDTQLCCLGNVFTKINRYTSKCCGSAMYSSRSQICCDPQDGTEPILYPLTRFGLNSACCGAVIFNTTAEFCCEGRLTPKTYTQSDCCAGRIYNREENICCRNELQPIGRNVPWSRAECCGGRCYFRGPQSCCNERIYMAQVRSNVTCDIF